MRIRLQDITRFKEQDRAVKQQKKNWTEEDGGLSYRNLHLLSRGFHVAQQTGTHSHKHEAIVIQI